MTVAQLIQALQAMPPEARVTFFDSDYDWEEIVAVEPPEVLPFLDGHYLAVALIPRRYL